MLRLFHIVAGSILNVLKMKIDDSITRLLLQKQKGNGMSRDRTGGL